MITGLMTGCSWSFESLEYKRGSRALAKQEYAQAINHFQKVIQRNPESDLAITSAREAARVSLFELKDFSKAEEFYSYLVKYSRDEKERRDSQKAIANIYFEKINDYSKAIGEFNKLLILRGSREEQVDLHFKIARSHFYLNQFADALHEADAALKLNENPDIEFELRAFQANIDFNTRHLDSAIRNYESLMKEFPAKAKEEGIAMNLVVCFEEQDAFDKAIGLLEQIRPNHKDPEFIDLKIKRLKDRRANLPGSKGLRK
jgi:tetratricopeptide (TPR) repeat protein